MSSAMTKTMFGLASAAGDGSGNRTAPAARAAATRGAIAVMTCRSTGCRAGLPGRAAGPADRVEPGLEVADRVGVVRRQVLPLPLVGGEVVELGLRVVPEFDVRVRVHPGALGRLD